MKDDIYRLNFLFESGLLLEKDGDNHKQALNVAKDSASPLIIKRLEAFVSRPSARRSVNGDTPLHKACSENIKANNVFSLVEAGASVNARNKQGIRPMHLACSLANIKIINVDLNGKSPLYEALTSKYDRTDVLIRFLELNANLTYLDQDRNNLLHVALISQKFDNAELLIDHFEEINALNCFDENALHIAADLGPKSLIEKLLERGADAKFKDSDGNTALHRAVTYNTIDVVRTLLKDGISEVNALNSNNESAVFLALKRVGSSSFIQVLSENGADLNIKNSAGKTALDLALKGDF